MNVVVDVNDVVGVVNVVNVVNVSERITCDNSYIICKTKWMKDVFIYLY